MNPELELAKDQLWKFKLRQEHAQLVKDMDKHSQAFTAFAEEAKAVQERLKEQITGLKSRFEKLVDDNVKQAREDKDHQRIIEEKFAEVDEIKAHLKALGVHVDSLESRESILVEPDVPSTPTPTPQVHTTAAAAAAAKIPTASLAPSTPSLQSTVKASPKPAPHNVANTGLRKSRRRARKEEPSCPRAPPAYAGFPHPPLSQDALSFADYLVAVDGISRAVDPAKDTALAAMFVTGLADRDQQDAIVDELEKRGMCTVLGGVQVEMKCGWEDLKSVLKTLGLCAAVEKEVFA